MDESTFRKTSQQVAALVQPSIPFVGHCLASAAAFTAGLGLTQAAGYALRVSCVTPGLGPTLGMAGVGVASVLAGEASRRLGSHLRGQPLPQRRRMHEAAADAALDAAIGIALFKLMGGRFRALMPSNLLHPGACAVESLPAPGNEYASHMAKGELRRLFKRDGCHHCGVRRGKVIGDHIPPNRLVRGPVSIARLASGLGITDARPPAATGRLHRKVMQLLGGGSRPKLVGILQRYYPQCAACSGKQSAAVKAAKPTLVLHYYGMRPWYYAGAFVGLRHYSAPGAVHNSRRR